MAKEKKSFKKFAKKHLASAIESRRKNAKSKKEMAERAVKRKDKENRDALKEEREHQDQLDRLRETDPQFYSYLEEEDPTLLQFGKADMELVDDAEGSDAETEADDDEGDRGLGDLDDDDAADEAADAPQPAKGRVTKAELDQLLDGKRGKVNVEALIDVFVSAVRELGFEVKENKKASAARKFEEPELVKASITQVASFMGTHLSVLISGKGAFKTHKTRYLVRRLLVALVAVISEGAVDARMTSSLLRSLVPFVPVLHYIKGLAKAILKASLNLCGSLEEGVRVSAYMVVRTIATRATGTRSMYQSTAFKGIFLALVKTAHQYNIHNLPVIAFLMNCVVDLYGTDIEAGYQHAFVYLRQLAIYLRSAMQQQTLANVRGVVNWQYLNALRMWGLVVSTYPKPAQLGPLIHPLVQLAFGLMDLFSSPRMFPLHLHLIEMLNHISTRAEGLYIPVAPYILRILTSPSISISRDERSGGGKRAKGAESTDATDLQFTMRAKKSALRDFNYRVDVWSQALYLLSGHLATHASTLGFPETFWAVDSTLRKIRAEVKVPKINAQLATLIKHIQTTSQRVSARRDQVSFGPCDLDAVRSLEEELRQAGSPLESYFHSLRQNHVDAFAQKQRSVRQRETLDSAAAKAAKPRKKSRTESSAKA